MYEHSYCCIRHVILSTRLGTKLQVLDNQPRELEGLIQNKAQSVACDCTKTLIVSTLGLGLSMIHENSTCQRRNVIVDRAVRHALAKHSYDVVPPDDNKKCRF